MLLGPQYDKKKSGMMKKGLKKIPKLNYEWTVKIYMFWAGLQKLT